MRYWERSIEETWLDDGRGGSHKTDIRDHRNARKADFRTSALDSKPSGESSHDFGCVVVQHSGRHETHQLHSQEPVSN